MTFAERLKGLRNEQKMSMEDVGRHIGVGRATIYKYEHGIIVNVPPEKVSMLAELFNVSPSYLMGWSDQRDPNENNDGSNQKQRIPIPHIPIPDGTRFVQAYSVMSREDRITLINIFSRAYHKLEHGDDGEPPEL